MKVEGIVQVEVTDKELGKALLEKVKGMIGDMDLDEINGEFLTDEMGLTYYKSKSFNVSRNPIVASLIDSSNYLIYGRVFKIPSLPPKGNEIKTLEQLYGRAMQLGINRYSMPDSMDIMWVRMDQDDQENFQFMLDKLLIPDGSMRVYGMNHSADVIMTDGTYKIAVTNDRSKEVECVSIDLIDLDEVRDFLLIYFKGMDGIHDYGKVTYE
ncbi:hypothetical protein MKY96_32585 [Paenibacillus sp. FSL R7-0302]|uniref:hypothetical protein n=1 Tax=Paenibacillus sp. FSL R7-0302 TaxID=2921681 RepID=UPI0030F62CD0